MTKRLLLGVWLLDVLMFVITLKTKICPHELIGTILTVNSVIFYVLLFSIGTFILKMLIV